MSKLYVDGLGETLGGDILASLKPLLTSTSSIWYVNSVTGTDGSQNESNRQYPFATLAYVISAKAAANDLIVLQSGHQEAVTSSLALPAGATLIGIGNQGGTPQVTLTLGASGAFSSLSTAQIRNVRFAPRSAAGSAAQVTMGALSQLIGCRFEIGDNDSYGAVSVNASTSAVRIDGCTFYRTAVNHNVGAGIKLAASTGLLEVYGCTFDGGPNGWGGNAFDAGAYSPGVLRWYNNTLLNGSDANMPSAPGWANASLATGGGRVIL